MALNVQMKWWRDPRRSKLTELIQDQYRADGIALHAWHTAQEYWEKGELIPGYVYVCMTGAYEMLQSNLAELRDKNDLNSSPIRTPIQHLSNDSPTETNKVRTHMDIIQQSYVYVRGTVAYLNWGRKTREQRVLAGKKSAKRPRDSKGRLLALDQRESNGSPTNPALPVPVPVPVPVPIPKSNTGLQKALEPNGSDPGTSSWIWDLYEKEWEARYGTKPIRNAKINTHLSQLSKRVPRGEIHPLIQFYLKSDNLFYNKVCHDAGILLKDCEVLVNQMRSGSGNGLTNWEKVLR